MMKSGMATNDKQTVQVQDSQMLASVQCWSKITDAIDANAIDCNSYVVKHKFDSCVELTVNQQLLQKG